MFLPSSNRNPRPKAIPVVVAAMLALALVLEVTVPSVPPAFAAGFPQVSPAAQAAHLPDLAQIRARTSKWIMIDLSEQRLTAYQGNRTIYSWRISSGVKKYPTVVGTFRVYAKLSRQRMQGGRGVDYYNLPNVPDVMYFYAGYAIHDAYWHNNFGRPMSHGCINMSLAAASWLYDWTPMGTTVVVRR